MSDLLNVTFTSADAVRGPKQYTLYELRVSSSINPAWIILKRYRDFNFLNEQLLKRLQADPELRKQKHRLAAMPKKKKFGNMRKDVVLQRQSKLEEYVRTLLRNETLRRTDLVMDFLSVPESVRQMILIQTPRRRSYKGDINDSKSSANNLKNQNEDEYQVDILLKKLYQEKDRVLALNRFEKWYFSDNSTHGVSMHPHLIRKLLKGYDRYGGLIQSCKLSQCKTAWRKSLSLLCKLFDVERNKYARMFIQVFLNLDHSLYREMDLHRHIKDSTQEHGFIIVQLIHINLARLDPCVYVSDAESWIQYLKWSKIQNDSYIVGNDSLLLDNINNKDYNIYSFDDYIVINDEDKYGHKSIGFNFNKLSKDIFEKYQDFIYESDDEYRYIHKVNEKYSGCGMQVRCKKDFYSDHWKLKISFIINHEAKRIYDFLYNSYTEKMNANNSYTDGWDKKLIDRKIVNKLDANNYICHEIYKSFNSPYKFRDFVVLRSFINYKKKHEKNHENNQKCYYIIWSSMTNYKKIPETTDKLRCIIYPSGFQITPYNNQNQKMSHVSYRLHLTSESVNIVTADLLGECDELFQSMIRISSLITNDKQKEAVAVSKQIIGNK